MTDEEMIYESLLEGGRFESTDELDAELLLWDNSGIEPDEALPWIESDFTIDQALGWIEHGCGVGDALGCWTREPDEAFADIPDDDRTEVE